MLQKIMTLVRWIDTEKGIIYPNDFIPLFEKKDLFLNQIYIFEEVCKLLRKWINDKKKVYPICINLSQNHLHEKDFLREYEKIQKKYDIPPELLEIELTEAVVFENLTLLKEVINKIHKMDFLCSMDDFGSRYSSLNVLKEIPVYVLKLDCIFFDKKVNQRGYDVIESIIGLAQKLNMAIVAEEIETILQIEILPKMGCDMIQGYVFDKPMPISEFERKYKDNPILLINICGHKKV